MPDIDPTLGLALPLTTDDFSTAEIRANWEKVADHPGIRVAATAAQLPTWGASNAGQYVWQADAEVLWRWNGTAFVRSGGKGHLGTNRRTADLTVNGGALTALAQQAVTVPPGGRSINVIASWSNVSGGAARMAILRGGVQFMSWNVTVGSGGAMTWTDVAPPAGGATYTFSVVNTAATTTVVAAANAPASISVVEV